MTLEEQFEKQEQKRLEAEQRRVEALTPKPKNYVESSLTSKLTDKNKGLLVITDVETVNESLRIVADEYNRQITDVTDKLRFVLADAKKNYEAVETYINDMDSLKQEMRTYFIHILEEVKKSHPNDALERSVLLKIDKEL